jgi:hypothetical protein
MYIHEKESIDARYHNINSFYYCDLPLYTAWKTPFNISKICMDLFSGKIPVERPLQLFRIEIDSFSYFLLSTLSIPELFWYTYIF